MVFSDPKFLFLFLPVALLAGLAVRKSPLFSPAILVFSLIFFYWSSGIFTLLLVASIIYNYLFGLAIYRHRNNFVFGAAILTNISVLVFFKYLYFILAPFKFFGSDSVFAFASSVVLPIGISFYTFQGMSYVIDIWRGTLPRPERNPVLFAAYLSFFPQLIAGPIVRFGDVTADFHDPKSSVDMFAAGAARFLVGLAKKVLIADLVALIADSAFDNVGPELTFAGAWIGALAYSAQIYFDFSGYSDMAIGMCLMFGIRIPENFMHPYASRTITEFWRRWHISLSTWFRDYLYIPLGGNRSGSGRTYLNLLIVFLATGIWHGAAWTFAAWGLYHGAFLVIERILLGHGARDLGPAWPRFVYFFPVVVVGWVLFRSDDLSDFLTYLSLMVSPFSEGAWVVSPAVAAACSPLAVVALTVGLGAMLMQRQLRPLGVVMMAAADTGPRKAARLGFIACAACLTTAFVLTQGYSPFLYFRF